MGQDYATPVRRWRGGDGALPSFAFLFLMQARGALFQEDAVPAGVEGFHWTWFLAGCWIALALLSAAGAGCMALKKGRSAAPGFLAGLLLGPIGLLMACCLPAREKRPLPPGLGKVPVTAAPRPCPRCGAANHPSASACPACGAPLEPAVPSEVLRARLAGEERPS